MRVTKSKSPSERNMLPTMRPSQSENKHSNSQSPLNRQVSASTRHPSVLLSSGIVAKGRNARSRYNDSRIKEAEESMARSVLNQPREYTRLVPKRAAYKNRRNCDMITSNYEEEFGPTDLSFQTMPPTPSNGPASGPSVARPESSSPNYNHPSSRSLTPINSSPVSYRRAIRTKLLTNIRTSNLLGKRT
jgi:hypothetical protein